MTTLHLSSGQSNQPASHTEKYLFAPEAPNWLSSSNSPFREETRIHLDKRGRQDPRVFELLSRLEAKGAEGLREREWARRICQEDMKVLRELHETFGAQDEQDILLLAAYRSDHSYAHFFSSYASAPKEKWGAYAETTRLIAPIVAELQPRVALGYAAQIFDAFDRANDRADARDLFVDIARQHPRQVLMMKQRFNDFPECTRSAILDAAEEARASQAPQGQSEALAEDTLSRLDDVRERWRIDPLTRGEPTR